MKAATPSTSACCRISPTIDPVRRADQLQRRDRAQLVHGQRVDDQCQDHRRDGDQDGHEHAKLALHLVDDELGQEAFLLCLGHRRKMLPALDLGRDHCGGHAWRRRTSTALMSPVCGGGRPAACSRRCSAGGTANCSDCASSSVTHATGSPAEVTMPLVRPTTV